MQAAPRINIEYRILDRTLLECMASGDRQRLLFAFALTAGGVDGAFVPMLVRLAIDEPPHVEMSGGVSLAGVARIGPRADRGNADDVLTLSRHRDDLSAPVFGIGRDGTRSG